MPAIGQTAKPRAVVTPVERAGFLAEVDAAMANLDLGTPTTAAVQPSAMALAPAVASAKAPMAAGIALTIRVRRPLFRLPWRSATIY
jgi:hypothetical protein